MTTRVEWGQTWEWIESSRVWKSTTGINEVHVFSTSDGWMCRVWYPGGGFGDSRAFEFTGKDAESRAFCVGDTFTRQRQH